MVQMLVSFDHVLEKGIFNEVCRKYLEGLDGAADVLMNVDVAIVKAEVMQIPLGEFVLVNEKRGDIRWELYRRYLESKNMKCIEIYWGDCVLRVSDNGTARIYNEEVNGYFEISIEELYDLRDIMESSEREEHICYDDEICERIWSIVFEGFVLYLDRDVLDEMIAEIEDVMDAQ